MRDGAATGGVRDGAATGGAVDCIKQEAAYLLTWKVLVAAL